MKHPNKIPRIQRLLSLPLERNRNCEEPVKGQARWRGSLRSPLTEPSQFQPTPPLWKRKKKNRNTASVAPSVPARSRMCAQSQLSDFDYSSSQPPLGAERPTWLTAREAAQYLNVKVRTILLWARQGRVKAYALTGTQRRIWRFLHADLNAIVTQKKPVVSSAQPSVLANERRL
jgi:excisionase family DNA binding protein